DADSDGICDSNYTLKINNIDYLPLAKVTGQDFTSPVITINTPTYSSTTSDPTPELNATFDETVAYTWYNVNNIANSTPITNTNNLIVTLPSLSDGAHNVTVYANDSAGNLNSIIVYFTVDTSPDSIKNLTHITGTTWINWAWTDPSDSDFEKVMVYLNGTFLTNVSKGIHSYNVTGLTPDTSYILSTQTVDIFGNINSTWANHTAKTVDATLPILSITSPDNGELVNTTIVSVSGTASDSSGISSVAVNGIAVTISNTSWVASVSLSEGANTITVIATDNSGNTATLARTVTLDSTPPVITIASPADGSIFTKPTIFVSGTASDTSGSGVTNVTVNGEIATGTTTWSSEITLKNDGTNNITVEAYDAAGNIKSTSIEVTYVPPKFTYSNDFILPYAHNTRYYGHYFRSGVYLIPLNDTTVWIDKDNDGIPEQTMDAYATKTNFIANLPSGARITSVEPMMAYYYRHENNYGTYDDVVSTYTILPTGLLGQDYWIPSGTPATGQERRGITHIAAVNDTTSVQIDTNKDGIPDITFSLDSGTIVTKELPTGSHITSSGPLAVTLDFSYYTNEESDYVQILPTEMLGTDYWLYANFDDVRAQKISDASGVYIVVTKDNTIVNIETSSGSSGVGSEQTYNKGDAIYRDILTTTHIESSKPIQVLYRYDLIRRDPWAGKNRHMMASMPVIPTPSLGKEFDHGYILQATQDGTTVQYDTNRDQIVDFTQTLNGGEFNDASTRRPSPHIGKYVPDLGIINSSAPLQNYNYNIGDWSGVDDAISFYLVPSSNATLMIKINAPPVIDGITFNPLTPKVGDTINFNSSAHDSDGSITNYEWNFGDGNNASIQNNTHSYTTAGTYNVVLTVTDNDGASTSKMYTIIVQALVASYDVKIPTRLNVSDVGQPIGYQLVIKNTGDLTDTYTLVLNTETQVAATQSVETITLSSGATKVIQITLSSNIPGIYVTSISVSSENTTEEYTDILKSKHKDILYTKPDSYEVATNISGSASANVSFNVAVTNTGMTSHVYAVNAIEPANMTLDITSSRTIEPGVTEIFVMNANTSDEGIYSIPVTVSSGEIVRTFTLYATFTRDDIYGVAISSDYTQKNADGTDTAIYNLTVRNTGNAKDTVELYAINDNIDTANLNISTLILDADEEKIVTLTVNNDIGGTFKTSVVAISSGDTSKLETIELTTFFMDYSCSLQVSPSEST
ncbi:MAG: PKD domain-containing protein, partial [Methanosarcinales archaeon]|nr:PKD domain-containing protein [Methanosarcinales archaeon]